MGVLANHVPSIEQLRPGLIEVIEEAGGSKQFFRTCYRTRATHRRKETAERQKRLLMYWIVLVSGGFAVVQSGSKLSINAVEGYALEDFSAEVCSYQMMWRHWEDADEDAGCKEPDCRGTEGCQWWR